MFVLKVQFSMNCYVKQISENHHFFILLALPFLEGTLGSKPHKKCKIVGSESKLLQLFDAAVTFIIWSRSQQHQTVARVKCFHCQQSLLFYAV